MTIEEYQKSLHGAMGVGNGVSGGGLLPPAKNTGTKPDPWAHRSDGMKCKTCMWFVPKADMTKPAYDMGRCRRHAPSMNGYPVVFVNDWCGDHKLDETKI